MKKLIVISSLFLVSVATFAAVSHNSNTACCEKENACCNKSDCCEDKEDCCTPASECCTK